MLGRHEEELESVRRRCPSSRRTWKSELYEVRALAALGRRDEIARVVEESLATVHRSGRRERSWRRGEGAPRARGEGPVIDYAQRAVQWYRNKAAGSVAGEGSSADLPMRSMTRRNGRRPGASSGSYPLKDPEDIDHLAWLGILAARLGDRGRPRGSRNGSRPSISRFSSAGLSTIGLASPRILGEREQAVSLLREAFAQGAPYSVNVLSDMDLEPLRDYGPFKKLMEPKA